MRKTFLLFGCVEFRLDENPKRVIDEPIELTQKYQIFHYDCFSKKKNTKYACEIKK